MKIYLVDDEVEVTDSLRFRLENPDRYSVHIFNNLDEAELGILGSDDDELFLVILDHDFAAPTGKLQNGYDLAQEIKSRSWMRGVCPIIYLTGRESEEDFNATRSALAGLAPDEFLSKSSLTGQKLENRIDFYIERLENFWTDIEYFGYERALEIYTDPNPQ